MIRNLIFDVGDVLVLSLIHIFTDFTWEKSSIPSSPVGTYDQLAAMYEEGILDFSHVKSVNLDEYVGLDGSNDQSYRYFMNKNLFSRVNICLLYTSGSMVTDKSLLVNFYQLFHRKYSGFNIPRPLPSTFPDFRYFFAAL